MKHRKSPFNSGLTHNAPVIYWQDTGLSFRKKEIDTPREHKWHTKHHADLPKLRQQAAIARKKKMKEMLTSGKKKCPYCKEMKSLDNFYRSKEKSSGYHSRCKTCLRKKN